MEKSFRCVTQRCESAKLLIVRTSTLEHDPMHVLVVPQAALTSKLQRGKNIQYHGQLTKDDGAEVVYTEFIRVLRDMSADILASLPSSGRLVIQHGTFGNRQSDGPFTHMFDM
ncbi:hypothetical protein DYB30_002481 [Aphanomyces astaci]|uniref:Uncharacterized protein n=1 Tax=Aphanomyces astaci TaxID=112090 RepID=A0A397CVK6_APHAT|nr:hypothetical protein DYB30_002481 [Aphanomyces astaci]